MHGFTNKGAMTHLRIHGLLAPEIIAFARGVTAGVVATKIPHIALQKQTHTHVDIVDSGGRQHASAGVTSFTFQK